MIVICVTLCQGKSYENLIGTRVVLLNLRTTSNYEMKTIFFHRQSIFWKKDKILQEACSDSFKRQFKGNPSWSKFWTECVNFIKILESKSRTKTFFILQEQATWIRTHDRNVKNCLNAQNEKVDLVEVNLDGLPKM